MAYYIAEECIGCTICAKKCPTDAIFGNTKKLHWIDEDLCIDCGVCGSYCPVDCIYDTNMNQTFHIKKAKDRPIAVVIDERCTGCDWCIAACPFDCLELGARDDGDFFAVAKMVDPKACVACKLCEEACSDKEAIKVLWPNGEYCESLGVDPRVGSRGAVEFFTGASAPGS